MFWVTHCPKVHACVFAHGWQVAPPEPQAAFEPPIWHCPVMSQQPEQLLAAHFAVGVPQPVRPRNTTIRKIRMRAS